MTEKVVLTPGSAKESANLGPAVTPVEQDVRQPSAVARIGAAAWRWFKVFWLLLATIAAGLIFFPDAIAASILSTPHPEIVYAIFGVAAVGAVLFGYVLQGFIREHDWFEQFAGQDAETRADLLAERNQSEPLTKVYSLIALTRDLPMSERKQALDHEVDGAEGQFSGRLVLPNLLSGSLVGLGLVGTFIGLLQTLAELSAVFEALGGGGAGGNASELFSTMIQKLEGPMRGMGTAFVASLYGLMGSLVMALVGLGVRREGDKLFDKVRLLISEELYLEPGAVTPTTGGEQAYLLGRTLREEHRELRATMEQWVGNLDQRITALTGVAGRLNVDLGHVVDQFGRELQRGADNLGEAHKANQQALAKLDRTSLHLAERMGDLRQDLQDGSERGLSALGRAVFILAGLGAISGLAAIVGLAIMFTRPSPPPVAAEQADKIVIVPPSAGESQEPASITDGQGETGSLQPDNSGSDTTAVARPAPAPTPPPVPSVAPPAATEREVLVAPGQTVFQISQEQGVSMKALLEANPAITDPDRLLAGTKIKVPVTRQKQAQ